MSSIVQSSGYRLVDLTKLRWRIERDYQELKQEVGLGLRSARLARLPPSSHAAYGFLVSEREAFPPRRRVAPRTSRRLAFPKIADLAVLPLRIQRHIPNSIATRRQRIATAIVLQLSRCPCCARSFKSKRKASNLRRSKTRGGYGASRSCRCVARWMIGHVFRNQRSQRAFRVTTGSLNVMEKKECALSH